MNYFTRIESYINDLVCKKQTNTKLYKRLVKYCYQTNLDTLCVYNDPQKRNILLNTLKGMTKNKVTRLSSGTYVARQFVSKGLKLNKGIPTEHFDNVVLGRYDRVIYIDSGKGKGEIHCLDRYKNTYKVIPWVSVKGIEDSVLEGFWSNLKFTAYTPNMPVKQLIYI